MKKAFLSMVLNHFFSKCWGSNMRYSVPVKARFLCLFAVLPLSALASTEVYVPLGSANAVAVVDTDEDRVVAEIPGVIASHGLAVSWGGRFLVAGSLAERQEGVLPPKPEVMSADEHAAHHEIGASYAPKPTEKSQSVGTVYLIDAEERRLLRQIDVPGGVHHVLITPDGKYAVATHPGRGSVSVIDIPGHQLHKELPTGPAPNYTVSKRDGTRVNVSNAGNGTISEIDTATWTVQRDLPAGKSPEHIVSSPDERYIYAVDPADGVVSRVDLAQGQSDGKVPRRAGSSWRGPLG